MFSSSWFSEFDPFCIAIHVNVCCVVAPGNSSCHESASVHWHDFGFEPPSVLVMDFVEHGCTTRGKSADISFRTFANESEFTA